MQKIMLATAASLALFGTASAADIGYRPRPAVVPVAPVVLPFSWTGCYLGGFAGGAWTGDVRVFDPYGNFVGVPFDTWGYSIDNSFIGGGTAGCNWQPTGTPWVVGIEGEFGYMSLKGSGFDPLSFPFGPNALFASTKIGDGYGMITGRVGYAVDRVLFYAKGGVAFVDESVTVAHPTLPAFGIPAVAVTVDNNDARWTVGGGVEWAFVNNWTLKAEYMAIGLDNSLPCGFVSGGPVLPAGNYCWNHSVPSAVSTFKVGVNYLFGGGIPLFARY
jgi:outer membrane immunogenic protein